MDRRAVLLHGRRTGRRREKCNVMHIGHNLDAIVKGIGIHVTRDLKSQEQ